MGRTKPGRTASAIATKTPTTNGARRCGLAVMGRATVLGSGASSTATTSSACTATSRDPRTSVLLRQDAVSCPAPSTRRCFLFCLDSRIFLRACGATVPALIARPCGTLWVACCYTLGRVWFDSALPRTHQSEPRKQPPVLHAARDVVSTATRIQWLQVNLCARARAHVRTLRLQPLSLGHLVPLG